MTIRVVLADDHQIMREGLASLLERETDIQIVGEAADGAEAVRLSISASPDLLITDLSMPRLNGVEAVVDKDFASAMLATELRADCLLLVTCVDAAYTNFNSPEAQPIHETTTTEMKQLVKAGHFLPGSMKPKVLAAIQYVDATGNVAVICHAADIADIAVQIAT